MHAVQRARQGLSDHSEEYTAVRERWAAHMNEAFREANIDERVDHRTLAAQGIDRQPMVYVPMEFYQRQIKGLKPGQIERLRADYRARVAARRELAKQPASAKEPALAKEPTPVKEPVAPPEKTIDPRNVEEIRKQAVQSWLRMRAKEAESSLEKGAGSEDSQQRLEEQRSGETLSSEHGSGERRLQGDRSAGENPARDTDRGQHAERDHDPERAGDRDMHGDSAASPGHDDDASM